MMKKIYLVLVAILVPAALLSLGKHPQTDKKGRAMDKGNPEITLPHAANRLGFDLFARLYHQRPNENILLSPYSIHTALCMAYSGARGRTADSMSKVMYIDRWQLSSLMEDCLALKKGLTSEENLVNLDIANSLWSRKGLTLKQDFQKLIKRYFDGQARELDFVAPEALSTINRWVWEKTKGKIDKILERIPPDAALYLINAIYFRGKWQNQFDQALTQEQDFHLPGGQKKKMPFMRQDDEYQYLKGENFQAVRLPYGSGRFAMYIFLPERRDGLRALLTKVTPENWSSWLAGFHKARGHVALPRFRAEFFNDLVPALEALGMGPAFRATADFSGMGPFGLSIDQVLHKTVVEVNEEGTEAAAVTSIGVRVTSVRPMSEPFRMVVDHPFLMAIADQETGIILFLGAIYRPE